MGKSCRRSLIKTNLPNVLVAFLITINFLQIAFHLHIQPDCNIIPLSQGFPPGKGITCFSYRISFMFHIFQFSSKRRRASWQIQTYVKYIKFNKKFYLCSEHLEGMWCSFALPLFLITFMCICWLPKALSGKEGEFLTFIASLWLAVTFCLPLSFAFSP